MPAIDHFEFRKTMSAPIATDHHPILIPLNAQPRLISILSKAFYPICGAAAWGKATADRGGSVEMLGAFPFWPSELFLASS